jgi:hypothetical protein
MECAKHTRWALACRPTKHHVQGHLKIMGQDLIIHTTQNTMMLLLESHLNKGTFYALGLGSIAVVQKYHWCHSLALSDVVHSSE